LTEIASTFTSTSRPAGEGFGSSTSAKVWSIAFTGADQIHRVRDDHSACHVPGPLSGWW
jgi:hypothetical protein